MLQIASDNSDRLVRLVNDILDLERLESGKTETSPSSPCSISDLMQQSIDTMQPLATEAQVQLHLGTPPRHRPRRPRLHHPDPDQRAEQRD
jgi:signal transduction histidine kinase